MNRDTLVLLAILMLVGMILAVPIVLVADAMVLEPPTEPVVNVTGEVSLP